MSRIGFRQQVAELCRREGLIDVHGVATLSPSKTLDTARSHLLNANPGDYVWVTHPGFETPDTLQWPPHGHPNDGSFIGARDAKRQLLVNPH